MFSKDLRKVGSWPRYIYSLQERIMRLLISLKAASGVLAENPYRRIVLVGSISRLWVCNYNMQYVLQLACLEWPQPCWFLVFVWNEIVSDNCLATGDPTPGRNTTRDGSILHNLWNIRIWVWVRRFSFCHPVDDEI